MSKTFKTVVETTRQVLTDDVNSRVATFAAESRQTAGLRSEASARQFSITVDEPEQLGGSDTGPNPVELVLAALATCQEITYRLYADAMDIPLDGVAVRVEGDVDLRGLFGVEDGARPGFQAIRGTVRLNSTAGADDLARLKQAVDDHCPVLDIIGKPTPVTLELAPQAASAAA